VNEELWGAQLAQALEFYAAWAEGAPGGSLYSQVERLLAGRKALRNFAPATAAGRHGSSLDGRAACVIAARAEEGRESSWTTQLRRREHLDALGLIKRFGGPPTERRYPSVSRVALDPYLRALDEEGRAALRALYADCPALPRGRFGQYAGFPYDGTEIFAAFSATSEDPDAEEVDGDPRVHARIRAQRGPAFPPRPPSWSGRAWTGPTPYFAILLADGDRMGATLAKLVREADLRAVSRALADFTRRASAIVAENYGVTVFAGGDDVLAFLPVDTALRCARALHDVLGDRPHKPQAHAPSASFAHSSESIISRSAGVMIPGGEGFRGIQ